MNWLKKKKKKEKINNLKNSINYSNEVYLILEHMAMDLQFVEYLNYIQTHKKICLNDVIESYEQLKKVVR